MIVVVGGNKLHVRVIQSQVVVVVVKLRRNKMHELYASAPAIPTTDKR